MKANFQVTGKYNFENKDRMNVSLDNGNVSWMSEHAISGSEEHNPYPEEYLLGALSACTIMTIKMYIKRKGWYISDVKVICSFSKLPEKGNVLTKVKREIEIEGMDDKNKLNRLLEIAGKCPVHRILSSSIEINSTLKQSGN